MVAGSVLQSKGRLCDRTAAAGLGALELFKLRPASRSGPQGNASAHGCRRLSAGGTTSRSLVVEPGHGPYWAPRPAFDLQGKADEAEAALADELVEIDEALHVREAEVAADVMDLEIVASRPARAHGLDTEHADTLPAEPSGRLFRQARKV